MSVQLGTVAAIGFNDFAPAPWLECFRQLGCKVVQAYRNQDARVSIQQMRDAIAAGQMPCDSLHGVFGEQFDPSSPLESARRFAVDTYKAEGELCLKLGGSLVVVHCSTIRPHGIPPAERERRTLQLKQSIRELGVAGQQMGVRYAFENLPGYHALGWDVQELADLLTEVGVPGTGMCFDTGHANMTTDVADSLGKTAGTVIYVHLNDNSGKADEHDMPTCGKLDTDDVARKLHQIGYSGTAMLEVFYSVDRLRQLIGEGCGKRLQRFIDLANGIENPSAPTG